MLKVTRRRAYTQGNIFDPKRRERLESLRAAFVIDEYTDRIVIVGQSSSFSRQSRL